MSGCLATTTPTGSIHPRCGAPVIVGLAEGLTARVDLTPLNQAGEIAALLAGFDTYTLTRTGLVHRDACRIASAEIAKAGPVLVQHVCGRRIPAEHRITTPPTPAVANDAPPY